MSQPGTGSLDYNSWPGSQIATSQCVPSGRIKQLAAQFNAYARTIGPQLNGYMFKILNEEGFSGTTQPVRDASITD